METDCKGNSPCQLNFPRILLQEVGIAEWNP